MRGWGWATQRLGLQQEGQCQEGRHQEGQHLNQTLVFQL